MPSQLLLNLGVIMMRRTESFMGQVLGCVQVDQSTVAIKETFGKFDGVLDPGCHCLPWCLGSKLAGHLSLRVQQLDVRCETKTKVCSLPIFAYCGVNSLLLYESCAVNKISDLYLYESSGKTLINPHSSRVLLVLLK